MALLQTLFIAAIVILVAHAQGQKEGENFNPMATFDERGALADPLALCIGANCDTDLEPYEKAQLKLAQFNNRIRVIDTTTPGSGYASRDWELEFNSCNLDGFDYFSVTDLDAGTQPFLVRGDAPDNALYVGTIRGDIGVGTSAPGGRLHVSSSNRADLILEQLPGVFPEARWSLASTENGLSFENLMGGGSIPAIIKPEAPDGMLVVGQHGVLIQEGGTGLASTLDSDTQLEVAGDGVNDTRIVMSNGPGNFFTMSKLADGRLVWLNTVPALPGFLSSVVFQNTFGIQAGMTVSGGNVLFNPGVGNFRCSTNAIFSAGTQLRVDGTFRSQGTVQLDENVTADKDVLIRGNLEVQGTVINKRSLQDREERAALLETVEDLTATVEALTARLELLESRL